MKDVAKLAGVSVSTVSRVINGTIPVDDATREKVEEAIRKMNFKPNLLARGLRAKSGHMIGLAVPEILHQTFAYFVKYTEECALEQGYNLILGNTHNDPEVEERFIDSLLQRNIDGIIFSRVSDKSRMLHIVDRTEVPIVVLDRALDVEDVPTVILDNYRAGELAGDHLVSLGHTNIGCITGPLDISLSRERLNGFKSALYRRGVDLPDSHVFEGDFKYESGVESMKKLLETGTRVTAIWAQSDLMAIGALNVLRKKDIPVPGEISIMGMDNISFSEIKVPALTTIAQPYREMCSAAVEMILMQKEGRKLDQTKQVLSPQLIVRESTA